jgi:hypothetical protein
LRRRSHRFESGGLVVVDDTQPALVPGPDVGRRVLQHDVGNLEHLGSMLRLKRGAIGAILQTNFATFNTNLYI